MKIYYIANFPRIWDEEGIAQSFEALGHTVVRAPEGEKNNDTFISEIKSESPDFVLMAKLRITGDGHELLRRIKELGIPTVSWTFDLYFDYPREGLVATEAFFQADYVFTTDGGHDEKFAALGIDHHCLRQGIFPDQAFMAQPIPMDKDIAFVGCNNQNYPYRQKMIGHVMTEFGDRFLWLGSANTDEVRGTKLNTLYASVPIILGDSVYSPNYWSNRIYETIGRGGFLIHPRIPGLEKEFIDGEHFVGYDIGDLADLVDKLRYYLAHKEEREKIRKAGFEYCREHHNLQERCKILITILKNTGKKE